MTTKILAMFIVLILLQRLRAGSFKSELAKISELRKQKWATNKSLFICFSSDFDEKEKKDLLVAHFLFS